MLRGDTPCRGSCLVYFTCSRSVRVLKGHINYVIGRPREPAKPVFLLNWLKAVLCPSVSLVVALLSPDFFVLNFFCAFVFLFFFFAHFFFVYLDLLLYKR